MFAAFTVVPYITLYMQANKVLLASEIPLIYLSGGVVTLLSARWVGILTDRVGKRLMFQRMLLLSMLPLTVTTLMQTAPLALVLFVSSSLFFCMNARQQESGHFRDNIAMLSAPKMVAYCIMARFIMGIQHLDTKTLKL